MKKLVAKVSGSTKRARTIVGVVGVVVVLGVVTSVLAATGAVDVRALLAASSKRYVCVQATVDKIEVHDDTDPVGSGELWFWFSIVGDSGRVQFGGGSVRFPDEGTLDWSSGGTYDVDKSIEACQSLPFGPDNPSRDLTLVIEGWDDDMPSVGNDHLGKAEVTYDDVWSWTNHTGSYSTRSTCPDGCFTVYYTIEWYYKE